MKEYQSLKDTNKNLTAQIQKAVKEEVDHTPEMFSANAERHTTSAFVRLPTFNHTNRISYPPCTWPCFCPVQTHFAPHMITESKNFKPYHEFLDPSRVDGSGMAKCLVSYPLVYAVSNCGFQPLDPRRSREADEDSEKGEHAARMIETPSSLIKPKPKSSSKVVILKEEDSSIPTSSGRPRT
ncbi:uncharacterized protein [Aristolochia californica]|uniref:uncharacterized protein n=1 Tax=Aristolochia californica TaxID=171875 RepID=UPI0035D8F484